MIFRYFTVPSRMMHKPFYIQKLRKKSKGKNEKKILVPKARNDSSKTQGNYPKLKDCRFIAVKEAVQLMKECRGLGGENCDIFGNEY